jgi:hypothetical protein
VRNLLLFLLSFSLIRSVCALDQFEQYLEEGIDQDVLERIADDIEELYPQSQSIEKNNAASEIESFELPEERDWKVRSLNLDGLTELYEELQTQAPLEPATRANENLEADFSYIRKVYDETESYRDTKSFEPPPELEFKRREALPPFQAVLPGGSIITRISDRQSYRIPQTIYVRAQEQHSGSQFSVLFSKDNKPIFYTRTNQLTSLDETIQLIKPMDATIVYTAPTKAQSSDSVLKLENNFSLHQEILSASVLGKFHQSLESSGNIQRFKYQLFTQTQLPIEFGLSFSSFTGSIGNEQTGNDIRLSGFSIGPAVKARVLHDEKSYVDLQFRAERLLQFTTRDQLQTNTYQSLLMAFGAEWTYDTIFGPFFLSAEYSQQALSLKSSTQASLRAPTEKERFQTFGIGLGYRWRISL